MTAPRDELAALLARVEAATGADRELDAAICLATGFATMNPDGAWVHTARVGHCKISLGPEPVASSIDAALALVERALPGVFWLVAKGRTRADEPMFAAELLFGTDDVLGSAEADTAPLAILAALLTALLQSEAGQGDGAGA